MSLHSLIFFSSSSSSLLFSFFFIFIFCFSLSDAEQNPEASILYSWLHSSSPTPSSLSLFNWNSIDNTPCNNWTFITCSSQGFITDIDIESVPLQLSLPKNLPAFRSLQKLTISGANLTGTLPESLGDCLGLKVLDLSSNGLVGDIPWSLSKLRNLETLILNSNQLTGKIPPDISKCSKLKSLILFDNLLTGSIPTELGKLSGLEVIRIGGNKEISGQIPSEIGDCSNLTVLGLAETSVSGNLPSSLGKLKKLETLSIYTTMISGEIPSDLGNCSELVDLFLYENSLSGSIPREIGQLTKLEQLFLWQNSLVGGIPEEIGNCSNLKMIDLSLNLLSGSIPSSIGRLSFLEEFMISDNKFSGSIPTTISNCSSLVQLQLDKNQISGLIPSELGTLTKLTLFFAWSNQLEGSIPPGLADCTDLQALDLSRNSLTGTIPSGLFMLRNLTKLLLISNSLSGFIPQEIGNCSSLVRLRLGFNRITGEIPSGIGSLKKINFLDFSSNRLHGKVPDEIGSCSELQMIDLSNNSLEGSLPNPVSSLSGLQVLDVSANQFSGKIPASLGRLVSLNKLILSKNLFSGSIPTSLGMCSGLQLLDLGSNELSGEIPSELGDIENLEIALNLSSNRLTGKIPSKIASLNKLSILDLSHNMLEGDLAPLANIENLVSLNISYNSFSGYLPDNKLFRQLSPQDLEGNKKLCSSTQDSCFLTYRKGNGLGDDGDASRTRKLRLTLALLITLTVVLMILGAVAVIRARRNIDNERDSELGETYKWQFTPFQKLNFSVDQIIRCLVEPNVIGKGCSGVVYRADVDNGEVIAVKKLWPAMVNGGHDEKTKNVRDSFSAEVKTLGTIRHKNIVRFLGCCWNRNTRLLPRKRKATMDSTPVNWEALDALIIDFVSSENLVEDAAAAVNSPPSPLSSPSSSSSPSISSSSYHSRLIIRRIRSSIESGDIETAIDILRSHAPFVLDDHRILFRLQKQKFIELLRKGTHEAAIDCLRTCVAPCALDAYPEAYEEFKHVLLALIYDKDDQTSPVANEWAEKRRYEMAGLMSSVLRASLQAYDPVFSMTLRYLISIHKGFCFHQGISSAVSDLTHRLLLEERDAPATPIESMYEVPPFDEVDIQALAHAVELTRQGAVDSMKFAKGDLFQAFQNELCRMRLDVSVLDELVKEYCIYRGIVDSEMQMITIPAKRNQSEVGRSLSRDCSSEIDLNTSQHSDIENYSNKSMLDGSLTYDTEMSCEEGGDVGTRYGSEPTSVCEDCSTSWSNQCENTRALLRIRSHMNSEGNKRKRWCGRTAEMDCLPRISFANSESGTNPIEDKYEIALALKELVSRGMAAEAFSEISTMDPDFFTQNPGLLFHLKQVEFLKLVSAGDHNGALKVACFHLGPLAANDQSLLKTLKETLLVLLQPDGTAPGKDLPLNDLANTLQVSVGNRLGIEEPKLMKIIKATLHTHTEWFKLQMCKDRFNNLLKIDSLKEVNTDLIGAIKSKSKKDSNTNLSSQVTTTSSSTMTSEDGGSSSLMMMTQTLPREALWEESAILKVMEFLAMPRSDAIQLLSQYNGDAEAVIQQLFG